MFSLWVVLLYLSALWFNLYAVNCRGKTRQNRITIVEWAGQAWCSCEASNRLCSSIYHGWGRHGICWGRWSGWKWRYHQYDGNISNCLSGTQHEQTGLCGCWKLQGMPKCVRSYIEWMKMWYHILAKVNRFIPWYGTSRHLLIGSVISTCYISTCIAEWKFIIDLGVEIASNGGIYGSKYQHLFLSFQNIITYLICCFPVCSPISIGPERHGPCITSHRFWGTHPIQGWSWKVCPWLYSSAISYSAFHGSGRAKSFSGQRWAYSAILVIFSQFVTFPWNSNER